jgi:AraC-like DNA-binding protein
MDRLSDNLPRIGHSATTAGRAMFTFRTEPGPGLLADGLEMQPTSIMRHSEGQNYYRLSAGFASYGSMSLPVEEMVAVGEAMAAVDLTPPRDAMLITPPLGAMKRLQRLHAAAGQLADDAPEVIAHPEAARGLKQLLIQALVECLSMGEASEDRSALRRHEAIMQRFRGALEANGAQALYIPDLCKAIGVSGRTLQVCCQEQLGMSPKRYLLLRRMHLARRALRDGAPTAVTVTEIATRYGFWHFGRFAGEYQSLFGETPSATLHRPRE